MSAQAGIRLLSALRRAKSKSALYDVPARFFVIDEEREAFEWLRAFVEEHNSWPSPITFHSETGLQTVITKEPLSFYRDKARKHSLWEAGMPLFKKMREAFSTNDPDDAMDIAEQMLRIRSEFNQGGGGLVTLEASIGMVVEDFNIAQRQFGLRGIPTGFPFQDEQTDGFQKANLYTTVARPGRGKALAMDARHLMVDGSWKRNDELVIGDRLASIDGDENVITELHPQGVRQAYRVTFSDGRSVIADLDHLWEVRCDRWTEPKKTLTTRQLIVANSKARNRGRIAIPLYSGDYDADPYLPIDPWLLGALIGDGCMVGTGLTFSTADECLRDRVAAACPVGMKIKHLSAYDYGVYAGSWSRNPVIDALKLLDLWGCRSEHKFIPDVYFSADRENRVALLQGLMDTDGTVSTDGQVEFASSSARLAYHVQYLVRSLGGIAKISIKKTTHLDCYRVGIRMKQPQECFSLPRKRDRLGSTNQYSANLAPKLVSIERVEDQPMQCISVSHPSRLYVTDDFIVTHNTYKLLKQAKAARDAGFSVLFLTNEMGVVQVARRFFGMETIINPKFLREGRLSSAVEREMRRQAELLQEGEGPPFYWLAGEHGNSVEKLKAAVYQCEPDLIIADASYLMKPSDKTKFNARHEILGNVMQGLHSLCVAVDRPLSQSVQFNRTAMAPKRGGEEEDRENPLAHMDLAKIAGTDEIGQLSAHVEGIDLGDAPNQDTERYAGTLKGREGETGWYKYNYRFQPFNMDQTMDYRDRRRPPQEEGQQPDMSFMGAD